MDVTDEMALAKECVTKYEFIRGGISPFPYLDYYQALARVRGAEAGRRYAVAFDVDEMSKRRVLDSIGRAAGAGPFGSAGRGNADRDVPEEKR